MLWFHESYHTSNRAQERNYCINIGVVVSECLHQYGGHIWSDLLLMGDKCIITGALHTVKILPLLLLPAIFIFIKSGHPFSY